MTETKSHLEWIGSSTYFIQFLHLSCFGWFYALQDYKILLVLPQFQHDSNLILINFRNSITIIIFGLILIIGKLVNTKFYEKMLR